MLETSIEENSLSSMEINGCSVPVLPPKLHFVYVIAHLARHLFGCGIGLRQLLDVIVFMKKGSVKEDFVYVTDSLSALKLDRIGDAIATIAVRNFSMNESVIPYSWRYDSQYADYLLKLLLRSGNFGRSFPWGSKRMKGQSFQRTYFLISNAAYLVRLFPSEFFAAIKSKVIHLFIRKRSK